MSYYDDTYISNDPTFLTSGADFVTKGLPAMAVSAGYGVLNTGIALGNAFGGEFQQRNAREDLNSLGGYAADVARYYQENRQLVDMGGLIVSSILPGLGAVRTLRAGQAALANSAAREGAGLLTRTASKTLGTADSQVTSIVRAIRGGSNTLTEVNKMHVAGGALRQATLESAAFETAALLTNNQNSVMNPDDLDYFDAVSSNLDTLAFGTVFGGVLGGGITGFTDWGQIKKAAHTLDTSKDGLAQAGALKSNYQDGANKGNNLIASVKNLREGKTVSEEIIEGVTPTALNTQLANVAHNKFIFVKRQVADLVPSFDPKGKEFTKLAGAAPESTPNQIVEDFTELLTNQENGIDELAKAFGGLDNIGYAGSRSTHGKMLAEARKQLTSKLDKFGDKVFGTQKGRLAAEAEGYTETALERAYYAHRDPKLKDVTRRKTKKVETAEAQADKMGTLQGMLNVMTSKFNNEATRATMTQDEVVGLLTYSNRSKMKDVLENTEVGKAIKGEAEEFIKEFIPELNKALNDPLKMIDKSGKGYGELGQALADYRLQHADDLLGLALKTYNSKFMKEGLSPSISKKYPTLSAAMQEEGLHTRFVETSLFFNSETKAFSTQPLGMRAPDVAPVAMNKNVFQYGIGGESQIVKHGQVKVDDVLSGKASSVDMTAQWGFSGNTKKTSGQFIKSEGTLSDTDLPLMQRLLLDLQADAADTTMAGGVLAKVLADNPLVISSSKKGAKGKDVGTVKKIETIEQLEVALREAKFRELNKILEANGKSRNLSTEDIAEMLDVSVDYVMSSGTLDSFEQVVRNGDYLKTKNVRLNYASEDPERAFSVGMGIGKVERQLDARRRELDKLTSDHFSEIEGILPANSLRRASRFDPSAEISSAAETQGLVKATQSSNLGEMFYQQLGKAFKAIEQRTIDKTQNALSTLGRKIKANSDALGELNLVNQKLAQGDYGLIEGKLLEAAVSSNPTLSNYLSKGDYSTMNLVPAELMEAIKRGEDISLLGKSDFDAMFQFADNVTMGAFAIKNKEVGEFLGEFTKLHQGFVKSRNDFNRVTGDGYDWKASTVPAVHTKLSEAPARAEVTFATSNSFGTPKGWITARNQKELQNKINVLKAKMPDAKVRDISQHELDAKVLGDYSWDNSLNSNTVNSDMRKLGVQWDVLPESSERLVDDFIQSHIGRQLTLERKYLKQHYKEDFTALENADRAINPSTLERDNTFFTAQKKVMNAALGLKNTDEFKGLATVQEVMGQALNKMGSEASGMWYALAQTYKEAKGGSKKIDEVWEALSNHADHYNLPKIYESSTDYIMSTSKVSRDVAAKTVAKLNSITSWLMLRADQVQGMVNVLSTPITSFSAMRELKTMIGADMDKLIKENNLHVKLPEGGSFESSWKAHYESIKEYYTNPELVQRYREQGLVSHSLQEQRDVIDNLGAAAASGQLSQINPVIEKAGKVMTYLSDTSEEFTRFVVARSAERIIDSAIKVAPLQMGQKLDEMRYAMLNSVVTKAHGNYIAAQRPTLFQGWAGQALGLFQTYQFNLMQALTRNIERGDRKAAMMMVGFQGSIFGAQSLPGFQQINNHIGNQGREHDDLYSGATESFGKDLSHLLLYGAASSATLPFGTGVNFYTRGDLTPRTPILLPTSINEVPIVSFASKLTKSVNAAVEAHGVESNSSIFWQFLAHNGFNRPLAGAAQLMMGQRTSADGTTLLAFDELDNRGLHAIAKLAGTTTTDESIMSDAFYRTRNYQSMRQAELNRLGVGMKSAIRNGSSLPISEVKEKYIATGGDGANFDRWYQHQVSSVNEGTFTELKSKMTTPEGRYLQLIMD